MADQLKQALGVSPELVVGDSGEFTVWVDETKVSEKRWARFPEPQEVIEAVRAHLT